MTGEVFAALVPVASEDCVDVQLIFARGSGQNIGHEAVDDPLEDRFKRVEEESFAFFDWHRNHFKDYYPNIKYKAVSVHDFPGKYNEVGYTAEAVGTESLSRIINSVNADASWFPGDYQNSVANGIEETTGYLKDQIQNCPDQYYLVGGYSQGAQVMGATLFNLSEYERGKVLGAGFFGDPKYIGAYDSVSFPWRRGDTRQDNQGVLEPRFPYVPADMAFRTVSWCLKADIVCGGLREYFAQGDAHGEYAPQAIGPAVGELVAMGARQLRSLEERRQGGSNAIPPAGITGADKTRQRDVAFLLNDNSNQDALSTFKYFLNPTLPAFDQQFNGTQYGVMTFGEHDWGSGIGPTPRYKNIFPLAPLYKTTNTAVGDAKYMMQAFYKVYGGTPFVVGGGDTADPYQVALERAIVANNWRADPSVERNIVMIVDRPPKDVYSYNICSTQFRSGMGYPETNTYNTCYADFRPESFSSVQFPEFCRTVQLAITQSECTNPMTSPSLSYRVSRSHADAIKLAQLHKVKVSIVVPYKFAADSQNSLGKQSVRDEVKALAEATGGIFIYHGDTSNFSANHLADDLHKIFTKKQNNLSIRVDGHTVPVATVDMQKPIVFDASGLAGAVQYKWDFNDDGIWDATSTSPVLDHVFYQSGSGIMRVQALDSSGSILGESSQRYKVLVSTDTAGAVPNLPSNLKAARQNDDEVLVTWDAVNSGDMVVSDPVSGFPIARASTQVGTVLVRTKEASIAVRVVTEDQMSPSEVLTIKLIEASPSTDIVCQELQGCDSEVVPDIHAVADTDVKPVSVVGASSSSSVSLNQPVPSPVATQISNEQVQRYVEQIASSVPQEPAPRSVQKPQVLGFTIQSNRKASSRQYIVLLILAIAFLTAYLIYRYRAKRA